MCHSRWTLPRKECFLGGVPPTRIVSSCGHKEFYRDQVNPIALDTRIRILIMSLFADTIISKPNLLQRRSKSPVIKFRWWIILTQFLYNVRLKFSASIHEVSILSLLKEQSTPFSRCFSLEVLENFGFFFFFYLSVRINPGQNRMLTLLHPK